MQHPMLNIAVKAARRAAALVQRASVNLDAVRRERKGHGGFVSDVGLSAEAVIIDVLHGAYPDHDILTEEQGAVFHQGSDHCWFIKSLDGMTNFLHGYVQYAVSVALLVRQVPTVAVVFDPCRNDLYTAVKGSGTTLNDRRLRVSKCTQLTDALIGTSFSTIGPDCFDRQVDTLRALWTKAPDLRCHGAASLSLCSVAAGCLDGFWAFSLKPCDIAAGVLLVREAGGLVADFSESSSWLKSGNVVTANPKLLTSMLHCIQGNK